MEFLEIAEKEYEKYWNQSKYKTFLSSPKIGKLRKLEGWDYKFVGVKEEKKLLAAALIVFRKTHFNKKEYYMPRGPLLDFNDIKLVEFFFYNLKDYIKKNNGYKLRIDPYIINKQRDIDGNIVEDGIDNTKIKEELFKIGFKQIQEDKMEQVGWMFCLDLKNKTKDEIFKEMYPSCRNTIRKAEKIGININEIEYKELDKFQDIMEETSKRKGFSNRKISYYQNMYNLFHKDNEIKFFISTLNLTKYIERLNQDIKERQDKLESLGNAKYNDGQKKNLNQEIESINKRIEEAKKIKEETNKETITLSGSMFMLIKPEIIYLSSGNYEEFMKFNAQYLIQWELIKYGIENGFDRHNFYGIPANINEHPKDYGIYEFKRGFNGYVEELIGEYEMPISGYYNIEKIIRKVRN